MKYISNIKKKYENYQTKRDKKLHIKLDRERKLAVKRLETEESRFKLDKTRAEVRKLREERFRSSTGGRILTGFANVAERVGEGFNEPEPRRRTSRRTRTPIQQKHVVVRGVAYPVASKKPKKARRRKRTRRTNTRDMGIDFSW